MNAAPAKKGLPAWHTAVLAVLFIPAVVAFEPLFGSGVGLRAAGVGVAVGLALALVASLARWHPLTTLAAALVAYLAGAGVAALPETAIAGVVPTWRTIQLAVFQAVNAWKDLLTVRPPAGSYTGPSVMPWLTGLACAALAGAIALRRGSWVLATVPIAAMGVVAVAWGPHGAAPPAWPAVAWVAGVLAWWAWCSYAARVTSGENVIVGRRAVAGSVDAVTLSGSGTGTKSHVAAVRPLRHFLAAALVLGLAASAAIVAAPSWPTLAGRTVLRDLVQPPLDIQQYPTPLASFRYYETDLKTQQIMTVTGLPKDGRIRLAAMDTYDGITFGMSSPAQSDDGTGGYTRVGRVLRAEPHSGEGEQVTLTFETSGLIGPWVPAAGIPDALTFTSANAAALQDGLYFNQSADALLTTAMMGEPAAYTMHTVMPPTWAQAQLRGLGTPPVTGRPDTGVPQDVLDLASSVTVGEQDQWDRVNAIADHLSKNGFFSDANSADSPPGHRADRLARMLSGDQMVGDDEQYATLMALMARSLGIPARVVMGLNPDANPGDGSALTLRGWDMHVWVEVNFGQAGWVPFDPTPPRDKTPKTQTQHPQSLPRPQVLPPPDPPRDPVQLPPRVTDRPSSNQPDQIRPIPWQAIGIGAGGLIVLVGPFAWILLVKARRRSRRRRAEPQLAMCGAWDDIVDYAVDAGVRVPVNLTRRESSGVLADAMWPTETMASDAWDARGAATPVGGLAASVDAAVFGPAPPSPDQAGAAWATADSLRSAHRGTCGRFARVRHAVSLRSLRRRGHPQRTKGSHR